MVFNSKDVQNANPLTSVGLSRVGVKNIKKILKRRFNNEENVLSATIDVFVDLVHFQKGIHMSRLTESINEVVDVMAHNTIADIEDYCVLVASKILNTHNYAKRAEVSVTAEYPVEKTSPVSHKKSQEVYTLIGRSVVKYEKNALNIKKIVGVKVIGMTVCPCGQELIKTQANEELSKLNIEKELIDKILDIVPIASHNQRGETLLLVGLEDTEQRVEADNLISIVENAMSAPVCEVLKREDEAFVISAAHNRPCFVEDIVRNVIKNAIETLGLPDNAFLFTSQTNFESIHRHDAFAERCGLICQLKNELNQDSNPAKSVNYDYTISDWLM